MPINLNLQDLDCYYRVETESNLRGRWMINSVWQYEKDAYRKAGELRARFKVRIVKREVIVTETIIYEE